MRRLSYAAWAAKQSHHVTDKKSITASKRPENERRSKPNKDARIQRMGPSTHERRDAPSERQSDFEEDETSSKIREDVEYRERIWRSNSKKPKLSTKSKSKRRNHRVAANRATAIRGTSERNRRTNSANKRGVAAKGKKISEFVSKRYSTGNTTTQTSENAACLAKAESPCLEDKRFVHSGCEAKEQDVELVALKTKHGGNAAGIVHSQHAMVALIDDPIIEKKNHSNILPRRLARLLRDAMAKRMVTIQLEQHRTPLGVSSPSASSVQELPSDGVVVPEYARETVRKTIDRKSALFDSASSFDKYPIVREEIEVDLADFITKDDDRSQPKVSDDNDKIPSTENTLSSEDDDILSSEDDDTLSSEDDDIIRSPRSRSTNRVVKRVEHDSDGASWWFAQEFTFSTDRPSEQLEAGASGEYSAVGDFQSVEPFGSGSFPLASNATDDTKVGDSKTYYSDSPSTGAEIANQVWSFEPCCMSSPVESDYSVQEEDDHELYFTASNGSSKCDQGSFVSYDEESVEEGNVMATSDSTLTQTTLGESSMIHSFENHSIDSHRIGDWPKYRCNGRDGGIAPLNITSASDTPNPESVDVQVRDGTSTINFPSYSIETNPSQPTISSMRYGSGDFEVIDEISCRSLHYKESVASQEPTSVGQQPFSESSMGGVNAAVSKFDTELYELYSL